MSEEQAAAAAAESAASETSGAETEAPPAEAPASKSRKVKVRLLRDCRHGQCNDVVELSAADAKSAEAEGAADSDKAAVAYAASLPQNQKAAA